MASGIPGVAIVMMGVSGAGKTTIGKILAEEMSCDFLDADDFHSQSNKEKMRKGIPLSDEDRIPWLLTLHSALEGYMTTGKTFVLACSALRKDYREILRRADPNYESGGHGSRMKFVLLDVSADTLAERLSKRAAEGKHFMPAALLQSQLDLLEIDVAEGVIRIDGTQGPSTIVSRVRDLVFH
ncbi:hypothetical protein Ancab_009594 [Ancistrocladus abbreviatus]